MNFCGGVAGNAFAKCVNCVFLYYFQPQFVVKMQNGFLSEYMFVLEEHDSTYVKACLPHLTNRNVSDCLEGHFKTGG